MVPRPVPHTAVRIINPMRTLSCLVIAVALVVGCSPAGSSPAASPSSASAPTSASVPSPAPSESAAPPSGRLTIYSTVTQATVEALVAAYEAAYPNVDVEVFRAPSGEVAARIAAEQREGRVRADVLWLTDPLSMQAYDADGLLGDYTPPDAAAIAPADRSDRYWATRLLNMVIVAGSEVTPTPADWSDLADAAYADAIVLPDPAFAGSAFGVLGYLALDPAYGFDYYQRLKDNGAVQVQAPDEVTTGVAEGRFKAGATLDFSARAAAAKGSPVRLVWPSSGAITIYSPIALVATSENPTAATAFIDSVLSTAGQEAVAASGWQPARADVEGGPAVEGAQIRPDWDAAYGRQPELLEEYQSIFGG
jgi:iron(III) transport system substrate-binding protein